MQISRINIRTGLLTLAGVLTALSIGGCSQEPAVEKQSVARNVIALRVADTTALSERDFPGRARAGQEVNLSFRVSGPVIAMPADVGDELKAGDLVARIDPSDYETAVRTVQGQLDYEKAVAKRAQGDLTRLDGIREQNPDFVSQLDYDTAVQNRDAANASVSSLRASLDAAKDQARYTNLVAPFDGIVVATYVENFETVVPKQSIVRLLNPASIEFVISVPENLISLASTVSSIEVEFDAHPGVKIPATIKEISQPSQRRLH